MKNAKLIIDFDSTFVRSESLCDLADIALRVNSKKDEILQKITDITNLGMEGKISFPESLQKRFDVLSANKNHLNELIEFLKKNISKSFLKNKKWIQDNAQNIFIISGGFRDFIIPVAEEFGIESQNVLANDFIFDEKGNIIGFDQGNFLAQENGKVKQIRALGLDGEIVVIGDGWTDFQIKESDVAGHFIAFVENVSREKVVSNADFVAKSFDEVLEFLEK